MHGTGAARSTAAMARSEGFLKVSEQLIEVVAESGVRDRDTPYIRAAQDAARADRASCSRTRCAPATIGEAELFDEQYVPIAGTNPPQHSRASTSSPTGCSRRCRRRMLGR